MNVTFTWKRQSILEQLGACEHREVWPIIQRSFPRGSRLLEHGCGVGQWVRFLQDRGWEVTGLEKVAETVRMAREQWPDLAIVEGDCTCSPFPAESFDGVLSFGVVEHFSEGLSGPLKDIHRVLRPGGRAIISVPCLNAVRIAKRKLWWNEFFGIPRAAAKRVIRRSRQPLTRQSADYRYAVYPAWGAFYEYRLTPAEFRREIESAGLEVLEHFPLDHMDGVFHELNPLKALVKFKKWQFEPSSVAVWLDRSLRSREYFHCHMQGVVAQKPVR